MKRDFGPEPVTVTCPACDTPSPATVEMTGRLIRCETCGEEFRGTGVAPRSNTATYLWLGLAVATLGGLGALIYLISHDNQPPADNWRVVPPSEARKAIPPADKSALDWEPDAVLLEKLGPFDSAAGYQLRIPLGYVSANPTLRLIGAKSFLWKSPSRRDESAQNIHVIIRSSPQTAGNHHQLLQSGLDVFKHGSLSFSAQDREVGRVHGMPFARVYWDTGDLGFNAYRRGFLYAAIDGDTSILISVDDTARFYKRDAKLAETAVLTFRKGEAPK